MQAQIKFRDKKIGVEKLKKQSKKESFIVVPDHDEYLGIIRYTSDASSKEFPVGTKVYFGTAFQTIKMNSADICVMEDSNVFAVVVDEQTQTTAQI